MIAIPLEYSISNGVNPSRAEMIYRRVVFYKESNMIAVFLEYKAGLLIIFRLKEMLKNVNALN
ncbi:MAG: hypothetical protein WC926_04035 [Candidatus Paceibacterota bacterium]|jgi:hypothetical protein